MLVILDIQWPAQLGALYKFASAIVQLAPEVLSLYKYCTDSACAAL